MVHLSRIRHENDAQSVEEIVAELKQESYNPILCYKRQGILDPDIPQLPADGFVVAFQTKFQKDLYEMFASTIVCIDSTHKTNSHNFKLITVVVPDEYGEGVTSYVVHFMHKSTQKYLHIYNCTMYMYMYMYSVYTCIGKCRHTMLHVHVHFHLLLLNHSVIYMYKQIL